MNNQIGITPLEFQELLARMLEERQATQESVTFRINGWVHSNPDAGQLQNVITLTGGLLVEGEKVLDDLLEFPDCSEPIFFGESEIPKTVSDMHREDATTNWYINFPLNSRSFFVLQSSNIVHRGQF